MFCKNCGAEIKDNQKFCPKCGQLTSNYAENIIEDASTVSKSFNKKIFIIAVITIVILIVIALVAVSISSKYEGTIFDLKKENSQIVNNNVSNNIDEDIIIVDAPESDFEYVFNNNTVTITKYNGFDQAIRIPDTINGVKVMSLDEYSFNENENLKEIVIPENIKEIGYAAFAHCTALEYIELPQSLTRINDNAFYSCSSLKDIKISKNISAIGNLVFDSCSSLENITVDTENNYFSDLNGVLFNKEKSQLLKYPEGKVANSYVIPDTVSEICTFSFSGAANLSHIEIPDTVETIAERAFDHCKGLEYIKISANVIDIGEWAFCGTTSLSEITVDPNNKNYCSVDNVLFNKNKTELIYYACNKLEKEYVVPDSVETIVHHAFQESNNLIYVTVTKNVSSVESGAFIDCDKLSTIKFENDLTKIDDNMLGMTGLGDGLNVTIIGNADSSAELYAKEHSGIIFNIKE